MNKYIMRTLLALSIVFLATQAPAVSFAADAPAIERALEAEVGCADVLQVIASVRGAVNGLMAEVIEDHVRCHVGAPSLPAKERAEGTDELLEVVRAYLR